MVCQSDLNMTTANEMGHYHSTHSPHVARQPSVDALTPTTHRRNKELVEVVVLCLELLLRLGLARKMLQVGGTELLVDGQRRFSTAGGCVSSHEQQERQACTQMLTAKKQISQSHS